MLRYVTCSLARTSRSHQPALRTSLSYRWFKVQSAAVRPSHSLESRAGANSLVGLGGWGSIRGKRTVMTTTTGTEVRHEEKEHAFYMQIQKGEIAMVQYEWVGKGVINLYHTEVPPAYRGMGLAKHLAKAALDYAVEKDARIIPSCSYIAKYIADNPLPQYTSRVQSSKSRI